jgi:WD40 repeat protein
MIRCEACTLCKIDVEHSLTRLRATKKTIKKHSRFVQDVKFSPSGDFFASVGADAMAFLYDGKTGEVVAELKDAHQGSAVSNCLIKTRNAPQCTL